MDAAATAAAAEARRAGLGASAGGTKARRAAKAESAKTTMVKSPERAIFNACAKPILRVAARANCWSQRRQKMHHHIYVSKQYSVHH